MSHSAQRGRMNPGTAILLAIIGLLFFAMFFRGCGSSHHAFNLWGSSWLFPTQLYGLLGTVGLIQLALAVWVFIDAGRKDQNPVLWAVLVLFTGIVGVVVYLLASPDLIRRNERPGHDPIIVDPAPAAPRRCIGCDRETETDFKVCPFCGCPLRCNSCDKPLQSGWKVCPNCASPT